jgi:hypothetical protein
LEQIRQDQNAYWRILKRRALPDEQSPWMLWSLILEKEQKDVETLESEGQDPDLHVFENFWVITEEKFEKVRGRISQSFTCGIMKLYKSVGLIQY